MTDLTRDQLIEGMNYIHDDEERYGRPATAAEARTCATLASLIWDMYFTDPKPKRSALAQKYEVHPQTIGIWHRRAIRVLRHPDNRSRFNSLYPHWQETHLYRVVMGEEGD